MNLTNKCLTDFQEWLFQQYGNKDVKGYAVRYEKNYVLSCFEKLSDNQKQGDLLAFFRDKGIYIHCERDTLGRWTYYGWINQGIIPEKYTNLHPINKVPLFVEHNAAFSTAIDKACEIYNGKGE